MEKKKSFKDLTIVSVTGSTDYIQGSIYAIQRSCDELKGAKGLLISPKLPDGVILPDNIEHKIVAQFSYLEYNIFILYQLDYFIQTDYCLIVQNDGWVLNGNNWRDEFWDYDYIGAPIPVYCYHQNGSFYMSSTEFYLDNLDLIHNPYYIEPQNGGFSLRSKKLLGMPRRLNLPYIMMPPNTIDVNQPYSKMNWSNLMHNEDIFLTAYYRHVLVEQNIRFAPSNVALDFSVESVPLYFLRKGYDLGRIFGCHFFGLGKLVSPNKVAFTILNEFSQIPPDEVENEIRNDKLVNLFIELGYELEIGKST